jgi:hypothetical protein
MRTFGWVVTVVVGGYATYVVLKSIPDMVRYARLRSL